MKIKDKKKLAIIAALLIAVVAVSFGILKTHKGGTGDAGKTADTAAEQNEVIEEDADNDGAEDSDELLATVFFASDFQEEPGFDPPADTLEGILEAAKADGKKIDRVVICGDYTNDARLHDYQLSPDESIEEIRETVEEEYPELETGAESETAARSADGSAESTGAEDEAGTEGETGADGEDLSFVQGNHDRMTDEISPTGLNEEEDYLIYILDTEDAFPWKQGKTAGCLAKVRKAAEDMDACFDELIARGEKRPVFIAGHVPLHYTARTSSRHTTGDNLYSSLIFDVVNDAAQSLDIVYLFGHNHNKGWDCYMGGSSVYKAKGGSLLLPVFTEDRVTTDEYAEETLRFTYLNAGYVGYYMNCSTAEVAAGDAEKYRAADETLTGTVFEIYGDRIVITRYDADGVHVLGHAGEGDPYKGGVDAGLIPESEYSAETKSPQTVGRK